MNSFTVVKFFLEDVGWRRLGTRQKKWRKGHLRTHSVCGGFVGVVSGGLGSRQKKKAETSSPKHHKGFFAAEYCKVTNFRTVLIILLLKGQVRAICRFWVFDGNGLLGHRRIDSRWFEKNPPTESGWKRRSKKCPRTGVSRGNDRDAICAFKFAALSPH